MSQQLRYPILSPTNIPGSGGALYLYLLQTIEKQSVYHLYLQAEYYLIQKAGDNIWIANMIAQHDFYRKGDPKGKVYLQYDALKTSLDKVNSFAKGIQGVSIHMPRIGCGLAGGTWDKVQEVIEECKLSETYVYDFD